MDRSRYLELFLAESGEHLEGARGQFRRLKNINGDTADLDELYRHLHSLKGMAATMGYAGITDIVHRLESIVDRMRQGPAGRRVPYVKRLEAGLNEVGNLIDLVAAGKDDPRPDAALMRSLPRAPRRSETVPRAVTERRPGSRVWEVVVDLAADVPVPAARALVVRRGVESLGEILAMVPSAVELGRGEFTAPLRLRLRTSLRRQEIEAAIGGLPDVAGVTLRRKPSPRPRTPRAKTSSGPLPLLPQSIRVQTGVLDQLLEITAEIVIHRQRLHDVLRPSHRDPAWDPLDKLRRAVGRLRSAVMEVRLVPFGSIADRLQDAALDLAKRRGKRIEMEIAGTDIALDRSTLERLLDPLQHLIRNSVDHGIDTPKERAANGKDGIGKIRLQVSRAGPELIVELHDDGRGIDPDQVRHKAVAGGWIQVEAADRLRPDEILQLITLPGFSTADRADAISGRGVGMDVVATRIQAMGGSLDITSVPGAGTTFRMRLPLTVAILDSLLVRSHAGRFALPLHQVESTIEIPRAHWDRSPHEVAVPDGSARIPLMSLDRMLGLPDRAPQGETIPALVLRAGRTRFGLRVESILGRRDLVFRPLGPPLEALPQYTAAAILESGRVALLLNAQSLQPAAMPRSRIGASDRDQM